MNLATKSTPESETIVSWWGEHIGEIQTRLPKSDFAMEFTFKCGLKLRGCGANPVLLLSSDRDSLAAANEFVKKCGNAIGFIACLDDEVERELKYSGHLPPHRIVLLSHNDLRQLLEASEPLGVLAIAARGAMPFRRLVPFSISSPAYGNMFVGRRHELDELVFVDQDFALCGLGGMGKSSLIEQMTWKLREDRHPRGGRIVKVDLIDCPPHLDAAAEAIAMAIHPSHRAYKVNLQGLLHFLKYCKGNLAQFDDGPIDLILDEVDRILRIDSHTPVDSDSNYPLMRILCQARHKGLLRLTISGRHETETLLSSEKNPFAVNHDGKSGQRSRFKLIKLRPLSGQESWDLLCAPLQALGCLDRIPKEKLGRRIGECQGIPFQVQNLGLDICEEIARQ